jgi:hypothetical protein
VDGQTAALEDGSPESRPHPSGFPSLAGGAFTSGPSSRASSLAPFSKPIKVKSSQIWPNHGRSTQIAPPANKANSAQIVSKTLKTLGNSPKQALKKTASKPAIFALNQAFLHLQLSIPAGFR